MAIGLPQLRAIKHVIDKTPDLSILSLSYPDILMSREDLEILFSVEGLEIREDSRKIQEWHGAKHEIVSTESLMEAIGAKIEYIDIGEFRGGEKFVDLNYPLPEEYRDRFSLVMDPGTIEHCCNIGQALMNVANAVAKGGYACHVNPMTMINHGFFNICPTLYYDFYTQNGWEIHALTGLYGNGMSGCFAVSETGGCKVDGRTTLMCLAQKTGDREPGWPTQTKYLKMMQ